MSVAMPLMTANAGFAAAPAISLHRKEELHMSKLTAQQAREIAHVVAQDVISERRRQIEKEGYTHAHDDAHDEGEIALAAALYAIPYDNPRIEQDDFIALDMALQLGHGWTLKPEPNKRKRLVKAAALLFAEIERIDRAAWPRSKGRLAPAGNASSADAP